MKLPVFPLQNCVWTAALLEIGYLMQFQSDMLGIPVQIPDAEELSGIGAAYAAGISAGIYGQDVFGKMKRTAYTPGMEHSVREEKYAGWKKAVSLVLTK